MLYHTLTPKAQFKSCLGFKLKTYTCEVAAVVGQVTSFALCTGFSLTGTPHFYTPKLIRNIIVQYKKTVLL